MILQNIECRLVTQVLLDDSCKLDAAEHTFLDGQDRIPSVLVVRCINDLFRHHHNLSRMLATLVATAGSPATTESAFFWITTRCMPRGTRNYNRNAPSPSDPSCLGWSRARAFHLRRNAGRRSWRFRG